jgi:hypothetical protein
MLNCDVVQLNYILLAPSMAYEILFMHWKGKGGICGRETTRLWRPDQTCAQLTGP